MGFNLVYGYAGYNLRIDLSSNSIKKEELKEEVLKKFIGGVNLGIKILYDNVQPDVDALGPDNALIFVTSPLVGTLVPAACQYAVITKSPLTGLVGIARSHGFFGPELKFAGYDSVIIQGAANKPVYIHINNDFVEIRDAHHIWGLDTYTTEVAIKKELQDRNVKVACIGKAGENLVRFSCIENDNGHIAGRCGVGAVMGSKKVKAIAVKGSKKITVADSKKLLKLRREWLEISSKDPSAKAMSKFGTAGSYERMEIRHYSGDLPTKNLTTTCFPEWEKLAGEYIRTKYQIKRTSCFNCHICHDCIVKISSGPYAGEYVCPEYEAMAAFGSNLGISDTEAIIKISDLANRYGVDCIECSFVISLLAECYEKGILSKEELEGIEIKWGNIEAVLRLLEKIVNREGIGNILAEGVKRTAESFCITKFAVYINGMSPVMHDLRHDWGWLINYTVAFAGPTHQGYIPFLLQTHFPDEIRAIFLSALQPYSPYNKGRAAKIAQLAWLGLDCLGICKHAIYGVPYELFVKCLSATTGWSMDIQDFFRAIERGITLARCFNIKSSPKIRLDWPSERLLEAPSNGPAKGKTAKSVLKDMIREYYRAMSWDEETGIPLRDTLRDLGLEYVIPDIWGY